MLITHYSLLIDSAEREGVEPPFADPKSAVLPLDDLSKTIPAVCQLCPDWVKPAEKKMMKYEK